jgi:hypothetical protein
VEPTLVRSVERISQGGRGVIDATSLARVIAFPTRTNQVHDDDNGPEPVAPAIPLRRVLAIEVVEAPYIERLAA